MKSWLPGSGPQRYLWEVKGGVLDGGRGWEKESLPLRKVGMALCLRCLFFPDAVTNSFITCPHIDQVPPVWPAEKPTGSDAPQRSIDICRGTGEDGLAPFCASPLKAIPTLALWEPAVGPMASGQGPASLHAVTINTAANGKAR